MNKYNPKKHKRRSIRLKGYDYTKEGLYFVTICVKNRACLFGHIYDSKLILNDAGKMVEKWYYELEAKFPEVRCHEMVVMPNHFHSIIEIAARADLPVRADLSVCPPTTTHEDLSVCPRTTTHADLSVCPPSPNPKESKGPSLPDLVQWFKTMTTNEYIQGVKTKKWKAFDGKLWHRNYWERIIRDARAYQNIATYIKNNPVKWHEDKLHSSP